MNARNITIGILIILIAFFGYTNYKKAQTMSKLDPGCYATAGTDASSTSKLQILAKKVDEVEGLLQINNAEKDSTTGGFTGTYENGVLLADYTYESEGTVSTSQVIFKKSGDNFVKGYGDMSDDGTAFTDLTNIHYDNSPVFAPSTACTE